MTDRERKLFHSCISNLVTIMYLHVCVQFWTRRESYLHIMYLLVVILVKMFDK